MKKSILVMVVIGGLLSASSLVFAVTPPAKAATPVIDQTKTCNTIDEQITAAQAIEAYAEARYDAHKSGSDYWACAYTGSAYESACQARCFLETFQLELCEGSRHFFAACAECSNLWTCLQVH